MPVIKLIADSGATKTEWCITGQGKTRSILTQGISPYFLSGPQIEELIRRELEPKLKSPISEVFYYGTGCANPSNAKMVERALKNVFISARVAVNHDLMGAARALCGRDKGIACILGTGSNSCYYNGTKIMKNSPGLGYVLGDEGSGAYLGKRVVQYYLYQTFDEDLKSRFESEFKTDKSLILDNVYKKPLANRYLAGFAMFLAENRGHYMIENIIEDGLNDFFFNHLCKYRESWLYPINFVGSIAYGFRDVISDLCNSYQFQLGKILKNPMPGLIDYHS